MDSNKPFAKNRVFLNYSLLAAGSLLAVLVRFFPSLNAAYVICPWIYLPCFLYVSRNAAKITEYAVWVAFWCVSFMIRYWGILQPFSLAVSILLQFVSAIVFSVPFILDHLAFKSGSKAASLLVFPFAFASLDYLLELLHLGSLFSLAQTQFDNKALLQLASILGSKGITFVLALSASFIVCHRKNKKRLLILLAAILGIHLWGLFRFNKLSPAIDSADRVVIGWSADPIKDDSFFYDDTDCTLESNVQSLEKVLSEACSDGVHLLCFPEESFFVDESEHKEFIMEAQRLAEEYGVSILLSVESGNDEDEDALGINHCLFIDSQGIIQEDYLKTMLIPAAEEPYYAGGKGLLPAVKMRIGNTGLNISYAICFDGDFGSYVRTIPDDTNLFIDVSWDWDEVDELHYRIIGLRAVENGTTVVKPTICGYSTVTDYLGRIHSITHSDDTGYSGINLVELPIAQCRTIYHEYGNLIDALYFAGLFLFAAIAFINWRKSNGKQKTINTVR